MPLQPRASRPNPRTANANRLEKGPAYGKIAASRAVSEEIDWPTYRHDAARSGFIKSEVPTDLKIAWTSEIGGDLSSVVVADDRLFVAQIQQHTVCAINSLTGEKLWCFTAGGRVDSPPTLYKGSVLFGSADGHVYCLRASDGELAWRFRAAPSTERHMAFEQLESVWPVHGNILVQDDIAYFVAGRSNFLDGGLRFYRLDAATGEKLSETVIDDINPETGNNIQDQVKTLQMPVGLPDILSYDGRLCLHALAAIRSEWQTPGNRPAFRRCRRTGTQPTWRRTPLRPDGLSRRHLVPPLLLGVRPQLCRWPQRLLPGSEIRPGRPDPGVRRTRCLRLRPETGLPQMDNHHGAPALRS